MPTPRRDPLTEILEKVQVLDELRDGMGEVRATLREHTKILGEHSKILGEHSRVLGAHSKDIGSIKGELSDIHTDIKVLVKMVSGHGERIAAWERSSHTH